MAGEIDSLLLEKNIGKEANTALRNALRSAINTTSEKRTGDAFKLANSKSKFKDRRLQRITAEAPDYIFKQHYGFEGSKKNGVNMRLKATDVFNKALESSNVLETLATAISNVRADQVIAAINFSKNVR
ncbi:MAG: hypothetical protein V4670_12255 [Bacteroidota bacterium]